MTLRNLLPPSGHNPSRRESDAKDLREMVATSGPGRTEWIKKLRRFGVPLALVVAVGGVGGVAAAGIFSVGHIEHAGPTKSFPVSTNLQMTVVPDHAPVGGSVIVTVTGCFDPTGQNHAVSFNAADVAADSPADLALIDVVDVVQRGYTLRGTFRIPNDATRRAFFYAQCGDSFKQVPFETTPTQSTARACSASDLIATLEPGFGGVTQHDLYRLQVINVSPTPCLLQGVPEALRLASSTGRVVVATVGDGFAFEGNAAPMPAHGASVVIVETEESCAARPGGGPAVNASGHVEIRIGGRWVVAGGPSRMFDVGCGLHFGNFYNTYY